MRTRFVVVTLLMLSISACGEATESDESFAAEDVVPDSQVVESVLGPSQTDEVINSPTDSLRPVQSIDEIAGIWAPIEVGGKVVDASALGAYLQVTAVGDSVRIVGYDGCNRNSGQNVGSGPVVDNGLILNLETGIETMGCDESVRILFSNDALVTVSTDSNQFLADALPVVGSILYERIDAIPVDPRVAVRQAEQEAEVAAQIAEELGEEEAVDAANAQARATIRIDLPDARARWAAAGINSYTLRFENGALMNDPSFPTRRPVGGVWEIEVVDGVALENEWSNSVIGDTVDDWFVYIESQLDSHYLRVEFDPATGAPTLIDSQPLDDMAVEDPNSIVAWLVFGEVVPT